MAKRFLLLLAAMALLSAPVLNAATLNFDDIATFGSDVAIPAGYGGFNWQAEWHVVGNDLYMTGWNNSYGAPSPENAAFNGWGVLSVTMSDGPFNFIGADVTAWSQNDGPFWATSASLTVEGYRAGTLVGSVTMGLPTGSYAWLAANLMGVDELRFLNDGVSGHWWLMDNFTYTPVPEPATLTLMAAGFGLLARKLRRR